MNIPIRSTPPPRVWVRGPRTSPWAGAWALAPSSRPSSARPTRCRTTRTPLPRTAPSRTTAPNVGNLGGFGCSSGTAGATANGILPVRQRQQQHLRGANGRHPRRDEQHGPGTGEVSVTSNVSPANINNKNFPIWAGGNGGGCGGDSAHWCDVPLHERSEPDQQRPHRVGPVLRQPPLGRRNFVFADGSVQFLTSSIDYTVASAALGSRNGGETVSVP